MTRPHRTLPPTEPGGTWALMSALAIFVVMIGFAYAVSRGWIG